jgi:hypothetical protein
MAVDAPRGIEPGTASNTNPGSFANALIPQPTFISPRTALTDDWLHGNMFSDLRSMTSYFIIDTDNFNEALEKKQLLDSACKSWLDDQPGLSGVLNEYLMMQEAFETINSAHKQVTERLAGAEKTIDVVRTKYKDDYENLFKWYHNEYEILPLWYKRFGHVLKVLMGKRSFRSLFSDDVKKYKN